MVSSVFAPPAVGPSPAIPRSGGAAGAPPNAKHRVLLGVAVLAGVTVVALELAPPTPACSGVSLTAATIELPRMNSA